MKKILFTVPLLVLIILITAYKPEATNNEGINFFKGSWKEAVQKAQKENKPIFLDLYATWCAPCKLLKLNTFSNKKAGEFYNNSFINVSLNGEVGDGALLAAKFQIRGYPTLIYLDKRGNPILYTDGYIKPADFIKVGKAAVEKHK